MAEPTVDKARGALLGLAAGDAIGLPALFHRAVRLADRRAALWTAAQRADSARVLQLPLPFTVADTGELAFAATDDAEMAAVAGLILRDHADRPPSAALLAGWRRLVVDAADEVWLGVAERTSTVNIRAGLTPPDCGGDNPAYAHDGAVARAVPVGIRLAGRPGEAATLARDLAGLTHAEDGVWAAGAMAASVAAALGGAGVEEAVAAGRKEVPPDSWLHRNLGRAFAILDEAGSGFAAVPRWIDEVANATYSYGTIAAETLPLAYAVATAAPAGIGPAIQLAALVAKQSDSMPAFAGALAGAIAGTAGLPATWIAALDRLRGVTVPSLAGLSLSALAADLLAAGR